MPALVLFEGEQKKRRVKLCLKIKSAGMKSAGGFFYAQNKKTGKIKLGRSLLVEIIDRNYWRSFVNKHVFEILVDKLWFCAEDCV